MVFRDYTSSVLIVSASEKLNTALRKLLPVNDYWPVDQAGTAHAAQQRVPERVVVYYLLLRHALCPRRADIILPENIEH